ncbi:MAG: hypothetical protein MJ188_00550 [Treponema sp.]|nr:hypothetical protein [Treponema sp.]
MKSFKKLALLFITLLLTSTVFAQSDEDLFGNVDDDFLFGGTTDDDLFGGSLEDDLFFDDGIEELVEVKATSDLSKGVLFENGSVKIGGNFTTTMGTSSVVYADDDKNFWENIKDTTLKPTVDANLILDARPRQDLRMYTKFWLGYPCETTAYSAARTTGTPMFGNTIYSTEVQTEVSDFLKVKEIFTDFSVADCAFFRFGLHTVTWGTGFFFSPVSDLINTSSINPEDTSAPVDGCLNLRTQITFPNTQNCLWLYLIPSTDFAGQTTTSYLKDTAFAGKGELVLGGWEIGMGGYFKKDNAPKAMMTASGSVKKLNLFGEAVYQYGGSSEWAKETKWSDKTSIFKGTVGFMYNWKDPGITLAGQYYYDGNDVDKIELVPLISSQLKLDEELVASVIKGSIPTITQGHNFAVLANFGRIFGTKDITATVFGMVNVGRDDVDYELNDFILNSMGMADTANTVISNLKSVFNAITAFAKINYTPTNEITISAGPYLTLHDLDSKPKVLFNLDFTLGGGKF